MKKYYNYSIKTVIAVQNLITIELLDVSSGFSYPPETHDFYELAYIDSGAIFCSLENENIILEQENFILIPPHHQHSYKSVNNVSSFFIVCFSCNSPILSVLKEKIKLDIAQKRLLSDLVNEAKKAFRFPFEKKLKLLSTPVFGAQQLVEIKLEELLISLLRNKLNTNSNIRLVMNGEELENHLVCDITTILKQNLYGRISLTEISKQLYYSKTYLNNIFSRNTERSIMQYYRELKINEAKRLMRKNYSNVEIANMLNFESPTYFTKIFKKYTGITPSSYRKTILK